MTWSSDMISSDLNHIGLNHDTLILGITLKSYLKFDVSVVTVVTVVTYFSYKLPVRS
jgi:hypothetical protein